MKMWRRLYGDVFEGSMAGRKDALVLFMYLISRADDRGFVRRSSVRVVTACTGLTEGEYAGALAELEAPDLNSRSKAEGGRRLMPEDDGWLIVNFEHYQGIQKVEHRRESVRRAVARHRAKERLTVIGNQLTGDYPRLEERRGEESEKRGDGTSVESSASTSLPTSRVGVRTVPAARSRFAPPSPDEVRNYCLERRNGIDPMVFIDHYTSNGWKVGKNPMKDWKAAVRTWEKNGYRHQNGAGKVSGGTLMELGRRMKEAERG